jgi:large subunit ribosomal protein L9
MFNKEITMKVILRQDVDNLGEMGSIVNVKNGYARNYLIPRGMAYYASPSALKAFEAEKKQILKRRAEEKSVADEVAAKIAELQISIPMKVGEEGKLFGSVTSQMIADALGSRGYDYIDKRNIVIEEAIKSLGVLSLMNR